MWWLAQMSSFGFAVFWPLTSVEEAYGDHPTFFFLGLKGTHIPQLRGLVLHRNTPPTPVTRALIPHSTHEEGFFQRHAILSFCGSMSCQGLTSVQSCGFALEGSIRQDEPLPLSLQTVSSRICHGNPARTLMSISESERSLLICPSSSSPSSLAAMYTLTRQH